jgi:hypothetical protein
MRILPPVEQKKRRSIRDARVYNPLITVVALQEKLTRRFNRTFTREYLVKLADKVAREGLIDADRTEIKERTRYGVTPTQSAAGKLKEPGDKRPARASSATEVQPHPT